VAAGKERQKLSVFRGRKAKEAEDKRVLAQTAILASAVAKQARRDITVPNDVPSDVSRLMKENELENATIVFGQNAIQLFSYVFGQSMHLAIKDAVSGIEQSMEKIVEQKMLEVFRNASQAVDPMLTGMITRMGSDNLVELAKEMRETSGTYSMEDYMRDNPYIPLESETTGEKIDIPRGQMYNLIMSVVEEAIGDVKVSYIIKTLDKVYNLNPATIYASLNYMLSKPDRFNIQRSSYGAYSIRS
jgi:hypothetical protein